jgi:hemoglobin
MVADLNVVTWRTASQKHNENSASVRERDYAKIHQAADRPLTWFLPALHASHMNVDDHTRETPLYTRIGGYDVIAAIIDDMFALMRADGRFARFGAGRSLDSRRRAQQLTIDLICSVSGGPCYYIGRDMRTSHAGLQITQSEWETSIELTRRALLNHSVGLQEQSDFLALLEHYRDDVVDPA